MSPRAVLKAGMVAAAPPSRVVLRGVAPQGNAAASEPGVWLGQAELDAMLAHAAEQGFRRGLDQGSQQALAEMRREVEREARVRFERELKESRDRLARDQLEKWRGLAVALAAQAQALRDRLEAEVTEWTFIATSRLLGRHGSEDVVAAVRQVLADARWDGPLTVLLHADDLAVVEAGRAANAEAWPAHLRFAADARVRLGGCLVQSTVQTLDARLEVQLGLLRSQLDEARLLRAQGEAAS